MKLTHRNFFLPVLLSILSSSHCQVKVSLKNISKVLASGIDKYTNPCIDFYQHACGNWIENNEKPETAYNWGVTEMSRANGYTLIRDMLENRNISQNNRQALIEKRFYDACTSRNYSRMNGKNLFRRMLSETKNSDWTNVMKYYANKIGELLLFGMNLNEENYLQIGAPVNATFIKRKGLSNIQKLFELYERPFLVDDTNSLTTVMFYVQQFVSNRPQMKKMTILDFQTYYDSQCSSLNTRVNWLKIFQNLANGSKMNFTDSDLIYVDKKYIEELCYVIAYMPDSAIVNYLHYNFIMADDMYNYVDVAFDSYPNSERSIFCVEHLPISDGIYSEFINSYISREMNAMVTSMFYHLRVALMEEIDSSWMIGPAKKEALKIARELKFKYVMRPNRHAQSLQHVSYEFINDPIGLQLLINFKKAQMIKKMNIYLDAKNRRTENNSGSRQKRYLNTLTCYKEYFNEVYIDTSKMFPPYFHLDAPIGFNYGRLAFVIGHEISHAFDYGKMKNRLNCAISSYNEQLETILEVKKNCFVQEFDQYNISGINTINENICDKQGIKLAFKAMQRLMDADEKLKHKRLPNFKRANQEKLFFLSYANQWCPNPERNELRQNSVHSPNKFRIQGALRNSYEFATTFSCGNRDYMNPKPKCDLWSKPIHLPIEESFEASEF